ncbi:MAG: MFS transporter [Anaerolineales bacterium]|nr:MFS transporter [Anaerolineales bacterium]
MSRDLIITCVSLLIWGIGEGMFFEFRSLYLEQLGADPVAIGTILSVTSILMIFVHIPAGYLSDRIGRRGVMWAAWFLGVLSTWLMAFAGSLTLFAIGLGIYRTTAFVSAPMNSYVTAARGKMRVAQAMTLVSAMYNVGAILGPTIGGLVGEQLGLGKVYLLAAVLFTLSTAVILNIKAQPVQPSAAVEQQQNGFRLGKQYWLILGLFFLATFALFLPQSLAPNFLQNERGVSLAQMGRLFSISSIGVVVVHLIFGQLDAGLGFILSLLTAGTFSALLWQGTGMGGYALGYFMLGGFRTNRLMASAKVQEMVAESQMGLAYGLLESVGAAAVMLSPLLAGYLYDNQPAAMYPVSLVLVAGVLILSVVFVLWQRRKIGKATEQP